MRFSRSAIAAGLATAATFVAAEASSSSDVLVLGTSNFTENVQNEVRTLLLDSNRTYCRKDFSLT